MTRLELLNDQMWAQAKVTATKHNAIETVAHRKVYENAYYKTAYDISKGIGGTPSSFSTLDTRTVDKVLSTKFQGKNFSERIWGNTDILAKQLKEKLAVAIAAGQSLEKTSRDIRERFGVQKYYADRLIRTESNYFHNMAALDSYRAMGIEEFQFVATLDMRTSEVCQHMLTTRYLRLRTPLLALTFRHYILIVVQLSSHILRIISPRREYIAIQKQAGINIPIILATLTGRTSLRTRLPGLKLSRRTQRKPTDCVLLLGPSEPVASQQLMVLSITTGP